MRSEATRAHLVVNEPQVSAEACLILIYGTSDLGKRFALTHDTTIGRDPSSDICVDMSFVSRQHAHISRRENHWFIEDLGSRNGTHVNGTPVDGPTRLDNGDQIKIGDIEGTVQADVDQAGDEVSQRAGRLDLVDRTGELGRHARG